jgi:integrase
LHLDPWFGKRLIRRIGPDDLVAWHVDQREDGAATWSIRARWTPLGLILGHAARRGLVAQNPMDLLERRERPKQGGSKKRFLADEEIALLLDAARSWRLLIAVCLFGGLRISEALGLVWGDVDRAAGVIRVRHQLSRGKDPKRVQLKTKEEGRRDVVMMTDLNRLLRDARLASAHGRDGDPVFATKTGKAITQRNATRAFARTVERAKLADVTFHALRHTFASILIGLGHDVVYVADQLGHANPNTTLRTYAHQFRAAKAAKESREQLDAEYGHVLRRKPS